MAWPESLHACERQNNPTSRTRLLSPWLNFTHARVNLYIGTCTKERTCETHPSTNTHIQAHVDAQACSFATSELHPGGFVGHTMRSARVGFLDRCMSSCILFSSHLSAWWCTVWSFWFGFCVSGFGLRLSGDETPRVRVWVYVLRQISQHSLLCS